MNRAALYLRVSTEEQTTENQRPELLKLARTRKLRIVATYQETASAAGKRPELARLLELEELLEQLPPAPTVGSRRTMGQPPRSVNMKRGDHTR